MREAAADVPGGGQDHWRGDIGSAEREGSEVTCNSGRLGGDDDNVRWCTVLSGFLVLHIYYLRSCFSRRTG